ATRTSCTRATCAASRCRIRRPPWNSRSDRNRGRFPLRHAPSAIIPMVFTRRRKRDMRLLALPGASLALAALAIGMLHPGGALRAQAAEYPDRPIRLIVATAAGGASDILARTVGQRLAESWGQPVVVDPRPGANGNIAA